MVSFVVFWRYVGWNTILYLSAMQTIPKDLYEAATIDSVQALAVFYITLPSEATMFLKYVALSVAYRSLKNYLLLPMVLW
ncbi:ABC transporter permease subunit [Vibrio lentus]|nr:ABC transporter permease subunit [Vibrio lentus]